ncbi:MAG: hypothetical protein Tsb0016_23610 [Sphingomonadales bacterium]
MKNNPIAKKRIGTMVAGGLMAVALSAGAQAGDHGKHGCNPCAAKAHAGCGANPCAAKKGCNPCAAKNPCAAANPCAAKKGCNPCAAK